MFATCRISCRTVINGRRRRRTPTDLCNPLWYFYVTVRPYVNFALGSFSNLVEHARLCIESWFRPSGVLNVGRIEMNGGELVVWSIHSLDEDGRGSAAANCLRGSYFVMNAPILTWLEALGNSTDMRVLSIMHRPYITGTKIIDKHFWGVLLCAINTAYVRKDSEYDS